MCAGRRAGASPWKLSESDKSEVILSNHFFLLSSTIFVVRVYNILYVDTISYDFDRKKALRKARLVSYVRTSNDGTVAENERE